MSKFEDLSGQRFGKLLVVEVCPDKSPAGRVMWRCSCDCGCSVVVQANNMKSGHTTSCGCVATERTRERSLTHGCTSGRRRSPEYRVWTSMRNRCRNQNDPAYPEYGGRGIYVCARWDSFENFMVDMGSRPTGSQIDRIDNNGPYEPGNCRWADRLQQTNNRRNNVILKVNGQSMTRAEAARIFGIDYYVLRYRLDAGWDAERAISTPPTRTRKKKAA